MMISIIVPVFNAEKTLERCLCSICVQNYSDLEIILINDGSTDKSLDICEMFYRLDKRIRIISIANGGVSAARNLGIESARGDYVGFVDADDWISSDMYSSMFEHIKLFRADLILCNYNCISKNCCTPHDELEKIDPYKIDIKAELIKRLFCFSKESLLGTCWRMLVSRKVLLDQHIRFAERRKMSEDLMFLLSCIDNAEHISLERQPLYNFYSNAFSSTSKYIDGIWEDLMVVNDFCSELISNKYKDLLQEDIIAAAVANSLLVTMRNVCKKGTPLNIWQRFIYCRKLFHDPFTHKAVKSIFTNRICFSRKIFLQLLLIKLHCSLLVVSYHSIKNKTLFTKT